MSGDSGILNFVPSIKVIRVKFLLQYYAIPKKWIRLIPFLFKTLKWKHLWQRLDDGNKLEEEQDLGNMVRLPGWKLQGALLYIRVMSLQPARRVPHLILMERQPWKNVFNQWRRHAKCMCSPWLISLGRFLRSVRTWKMTRITPTLTLNLVLYGAFVHIFCNLLVVLLCSRAYTVSFPFW